MRGRKRGNDGKRKRVGRNKKSSTSIEFFSDLCFIPLLF